VAGAERRPLQGAQHRNIPRRQCDPNGIGCTHVLVSSPTRERAAPRTQTAQLPARLVPTYRRRAPGYWARPVSYLLAPRGHAFFKNRTLPRLPALTIIACLPPPGRLRPPFHLRQGGVCWEVRRVLFPSKEWRKLKEKLDKADRRQNSKALCSNTIYGVSLTASRCCCAKSNAGNESTGDISVPAQAARHVWGVDDTHYSDRSVPNSSSLADSARAPVLQTGDSQRRRDARKCFIRQACNRAAVIPPLDTSLTV
jgi:hypothetical protein